VRNGGADHDGRATAVYVNAKQAQFGRSNVPSNAVFRTVRILFSFRRVIDPPFSEAGCDWPFLVFRGQQYVRRAAAVTVTCDSGELVGDFAQRLSAVLRDKPMKVKS